MEEKEFHSVLETFEEYFTILLNTQDNLLQKRGIFVASNVQSCHMRIWSLNGLHFFFFCIFKTTILLVLCVIIFAVQCDILEVELVMQFDPHLTFLLNKVQSFHDKCKLTILPTHQNGKHQSNSSN